MKASAIGSIEATRKVIELCNEHKIYPDIKVCKCVEENERENVRGRGGLGGVCVCLSVCLCVGEENVKAKAERPCIILQHALQCTLQQTVTRSATDCNTEHNRLQHISQHTIQRTRPRKDNTRCNRL